MSSKTSVVEDSPIWEVMRGMGPVMGLDGCSHHGPTVDGAVMCSIMVLNSVLERQGNQILEEHGLTLPQWLALGCVAAGGTSGVPHAQIGSKLMLSKAPVTGVVDRLERAGLAKRHPDPHDRRVSRVVITEDGLAMWWRVKNSFSNFSNQLFDGFLKEDEQERLLELLGRMLGAFAARDPHIMSEWKRAASDGDEKSQ
ncbi:hypothetical protein IAD21_04628 [Abditibacteriota bacterium]|nr:hypothetical protein IAD21_04628 [Abditibacteriota bacterium]